MLLSPTMAKRLMRVLAAALLLSLTLAPSMAHAEDPYEIYVILPLTGFAAFLGAGVATTLGVVQDITNQHGGIHGRPVKFVIEDDQSTPQVTLQLTQAVAAKHVPAMLGSAVSAMCQAQLPAIKDGPLTWCMSPVVRPPVGSFMFTVLQTTDDYVEVCLRYAEARGWHKLAIITTTDASGQDFDATLDRVLAKPEHRGETIVSRDHYNISDISVAAQVAHIKSSGADAMFGWSAGTSFSTLLHADVDAGVDLPLFTSAANLVTAQMKTLSSIAPTALYIPGTAAYAPNLLRDGPQKQAVLEYINAMRARGLPIDQTTLNGWDEPTIIINALRKFGTNATAEQLRSYLAAYKGPGIVGNYDFPQYPQRGLDASSVLIVRWDQARQTWSGASQFGGTPVK
jgi:branched-chain amino acid transport system substrate-binding protein